MIRKIVRIDEEKCNGCGACAAACHEGAIAMVNGKARLMRDDYCDGMGDCLPACPAGAISFEVREAAAYDEAAVRAARAENAARPAGGCPGARMKRMERKTYRDGAAGEIESRLMQWPVQIRLCPVRAPYFEDARLLVAADCTAFACGDFHRRFMEGRVTLIGCPKLDDVDYSEKLCAILRANSVRDITVARMEVPCCGGLERAVKKAAAGCGRDVPVRVRVIGIDGRPIEEE